MKKYVLILITIIAAVCVCLSGCTQAEKASYNLSKQADNFNDIRPVSYTHLDVYKRQH